MEVKDTTNRIENEYLEQIRRLTQDVAYWKEYASDLMSDRADLQSQLEQMGEQVDILSETQENNNRNECMLNMQICNMKRVIQSIQNELYESLTPETYEVLASVFDLDFQELPFEEV